MKQTGLNGYVYEFLVDYGSIDADDILFNEKEQYKIIFGFIKQVFVTLASMVHGSLASMSNVSNFTTCISLNNQPCMARPTIIYLNPEECN